MNHEFLREQLAALLKAKGCTDPNVLKAISLVPREKFVSPDNMQMAYEDHALAIECNQTISQPYVVAMMSQLLLSKGPLKRVLEIGTGSGYQAAILSYLVDEVYTIERHEYLYTQSKDRLKNYKNVHCIHGDGYDGLEEKAPFDGIIITAAVESFPAKLLSQMNTECIAIYPEGKNTQQLIILKKKNEKFDKVAYDYVVFVPMLEGIKYK